MGHSLSAGVAVSTAIAMLRALTGIPIPYFLIPGYAVAIILSFIVRAIMDKAGLDSKARSIVFSLPVTDTAGMRLMEEMEETEETV